MLDRRAFTLFGLAAMPDLSPAQSGSAVMAERLRAGRCAVLWRHAQTVPGIGDPPGFTLASCGTQRNLSEAGRAQARTAGEWFKAQKLTPHAVLSSAWCRCKDTADLAFGRHEPWAPLNSTFAEGDKAGAARTAMAQRLSTLAAGRFEVWVTHQVNITALTHAGLSMGEGLVVDTAGQIVARGMFA